MTTYQLGNGILVAASSDEDGNVMPLRYLSHAQAERQAIRRGPDWSAWRGTGRYSFVAKTSTLPPHDPAKKTRVP